MPYSLETGRTEFRGGKNILASEHVQFMEVGATLDATAIGEKYLPVGTAIARNTSTGLFEEYKETTEDGTFQPGYDEPGILNVDVNIRKNNVIVGEVIVRGSVYDAKLESNVTDAFKAKTPMIRYVKHI